MTPFQLPIWLLILNVNNVCLGETDEHWSYLNYLLLKEFIQKAPLPPPFNIIYYASKLILYGIQRISTKICRVSPSALNELEFRKGKDLNFYYSNCFSR